MLLRHVVWGICKAFICSKLVNDIYFNKYWPLVKFFFLIPKHLFGQQLNSLKLLLVFIWIILSSYFESIKGRSNDIDKSGRRLLMELLCKKPFFNSWPMKQFSRNSLQNQKKFEQIVWCIDLHLFTLNSCVDFSLTPFRLSHSQLGSVDLEKWVPRMKLKLLFCFTQ